MYMCKAPGHFSKFSAGTFSPEAAPGFSLFSAHKPQNVRAYVLLKIPLEAHKILQAR